MRAVPWPSRWWSISERYLMELHKKTDFIWEIPKQGEMKVAAIIYASSRLLESIRNDLTLQQAQNVACLPGIQRMSYVMPDAHQGYGFPIGGGGGFFMDEGVLCPR